VKEDSQNGAKWRQVVKDNRAKWSSEGGCILHTIQLKGVVKEDAYNRDKWRQVVKEDTQNRDKWRKMDAHNRSKWGKEDVHNIEINGGKSSELVGGESGVRIGLACALTLFHSLRINI